MEEMKSDILKQDEGEEQLASLIRQAGADARIRRKKALDEHFNKLKEVISMAASHLKESIPI